MHAFCNIFVVEDIKILLEHVLMAFLHTLKTSLIIFENNARQNVFHWCN
jgi:hypothetical protein